MDLQAAFITLATLIVGALSGAGFNAYFNQRAEKRRVQEGYREKVYEKVVESIIVVHEVYTKLRSSYERSLHPDGPPDRRDLSGLLKKHGELWGVLNEHSLFYPRDLRMSVSNASAYFCNLLEADFNWRKAEDLHLLYLNEASQKIDLSDAGLLNLEYTGDGEERIYIPFEP